MFLSHTRLATLALLPLVLGCGDKEDDTSGGGDTDSGGVTTDDTADDTGESAVSGTISGTVTVELYETNSEGVNERVAWEDSTYATATGFDWPYGSIYVGAYHTNSGGADVYVGSSVVNSPDESNPYTLAYESGEDASVWVYASVDSWSDAVVGSHDPRGVYPIEVPIADGDAITGIDISILATHLVATSCEDQLTISGDTEITVHYDGGRVATMAVDMNGHGPYWGISGTPTANATGASAAYELAGCQQYGEMQVLGAWDSNEDGMFAPDDVWGVYASGGVDANPITLGGVDLTGIDVEIPFGDGPGVSVVPFVHLEGSVTMEGGVFDDLPAGTTVYVAALKYRPSGGFDITSSDMAYDMDTFEWPDLSGESSKDFSLTVPGGSVAYLWAYADVDVDGMVNESGEPVASGGSDDNGRVDTGSASQSGLTLPLAVAATR
jgi:hypothetical protein